MIRPFELRKNVLTEIHIADLHFGAPNIDPVKEFNILYEQFILPIKDLNFDILSIDGDIFHRKFQSTSEVIKVALNFVTLCYRMCRDKNATFIIIGGTRSHDADQLSLFYHLYEENSCEFYIIEKTQFIYTKGIKILCIPEEYGMHKEYYSQFLFNSGLYDEVFMHGMIKGAVYGVYEENLDSDKAPIFSIDSFANCKGPIIAGHVHIAGCYEGYMYYCSSPIRFQFGEEQPKGFLVLIHDICTRKHFVYLNEIQSFRYDTLNINYLQYNDPKKVTEYLDNLVLNGIDHIRVIFSNIEPQEQLIIKDYYKNSNSVVIKEDSKETRLVQTSSIEEKYNGLQFIMDSSLSDYEKFVRFINFNKGTDYITIEKLKEILKG